MPVSMQPTPVEKLKIADPDLGREVESALNRMEAPAAPEALSMMVEDVIWALSIETAFGQHVARGYLAMLNRTPMERLSRYHEHIRNARDAGPTLGRLIAATLVPVLIHGDDAFWREFLTTLNVMLGKGSYTLPPAFETIRVLLDSKDLAAARAFLETLTTVFEQPLSYNQSRHLSQIISVAARKLPAPRRAAQIRAVTRVVSADIRLTEAFLESFENGLQLLHAEALNTFVNEGLDALKKKRSAGEKFLGLKSRAARNACDDLRVTVSLSEMAPRLNRYLQARTGLPLIVSPLSHLPSVVQRDLGSSGTISDAGAVHLPDEIEHYPDKNANQQHFITLVRLEAGYYEFGTFDFDLDRLLDHPLLNHHAALSGLKKRLIAKTTLRTKAGPDETGPSRSDLQLFFNSFPNPRLAADLFCIFEHGRVHKRLTVLYPGIARTALADVREEAARIIREAQRPGMLFPLYCRVALGMPAETDSRFPANSPEILKNACSLFNEISDRHPDVEAMAALTARIYDSAAAWTANGYNPLTVPFDRHLRPDFYYNTVARYETVAALLRYKLARHNITVYRSDVRRVLNARQGKLTRSDIRTLILQPVKNNAQKNHSNPMDLSEIDLSDVITVETPDTEEAIDNGRPAYWYPEWDRRLQDYLQHHALVHEAAEKSAATGFYEKTLADYAGLVRRIRKSFEMLKPQELTILRRWSEGDAFDYRALIEWATDRKAGILPSDRLYIKRLKQRRDVAVLLLVDLSRSTANAVPGTDTSVLDVEKSAIVLLCEALAVVGDTFAVAGFSGTGRLGVDYHWVKQFSEPLDARIRERINAMAPQRSTRMGAAVRHATACLAAVPANVRLLMLLSDGFPNDTGYKQAYAIEDTRRAFGEARAAHIYAHGINVNIAADAGLDALYGPRHHHVITDVRELPDKLFRIYGALTRQVC